MPVWSAVHASVVSSTCQSGQQYMPVWSAVHARVVSSTCQCGQQYMPVWGPSLCCACACVYMWAAFHPSPSADNHVHACVCVHVCVCVRVCADGHAVLCRQSCACAYVCVGGHAATYVSVHHHRLEAVQVIQGPCYVQAPVQAITVRVQLHRLNGAVHAAAATSCRGRSWRCGRRGGGRLFGLLLHHFGQRACLRLENRSRVYITGHIMV